MDNINRRDFLKIAGTAAAVTAVSASGCGDAVKSGAIANTTTSVSKNIPTDKMTYRTNPKTGDKVSILGYGMMRLPTISNQSARESGDEIDQETVNKLVDYAIEHGLNLFDTSPAYCRGMSEAATGIALSRYPRDKYFISTKLSNFSPQQWTREESIALYKKSLKDLQVDYIDYLHLHGVGMGGMKQFSQRYLDNGVLDYLMQEREAGRIKNLGFSFHGEQEVFENLVDNHDKYHWDFVMIQMNYVDWKYAHQLNPANVDAEHLYNRLTEKGIPVFVMEPILGGRLAKLPTHVQEMLRERRPESSIASWSFRWIATHPNILTILSGMTYMEHLQDNLSSLCPLEPCTEEENTLLQRVADEFVKFPLIPCTACQYCMPCPYGIDIPGIFGYWETALADDALPDDPTDPSYAEKRRRFLLGYEQCLERLRRAERCTGCGRCKPHCPQAIDIPAMLRKVDRFIEKLRRNGRA